MSAGRAPAGWPRGPAWRRPRAPDILLPARRVIIAAMKRFIDPAHKGLDPSSGAASAIAEVVHYNIFETLTKISSDGKVTPLLAQSWEVSPDLKTYSFKLRPGITFQNGEPFNAAAVKFSFERAAGEKSSNKDKRLFASMASIATPDPLTVVITLKALEPELPFLLGQATHVLCVD
eukprot:Opistho-2@72885